MHDLDAVWLEIVTPEATQQTTHGVKNGEVVAILDEHS